MPEAYRDEDYKEDLNHRGLELSSLSTIQSHAQTRSIIFSAHARVRISVRDISLEDILHILTDGEIIEEYEDDTPCP
jgi:hypothetical protein